MARLGVHRRPPYPAVVALWAWLHADLGYIDGLLTLRGLDLYELLDDYDAERFTNLLYALAVDEQDALVDRFKLRVGLDAALVGEDVQAALAAVSGATPAAGSTPDPTDAATVAAWGTSPEAVRAQEAMKALAGG